ncbi:MAG: glycine--tRNA ligase [Anaerovoracaceae bacterium]|jgi:glycyl-tRNA synthetase
MSSEVTMDAVVALAKNRGYVFPGSEIYGGLANSWDFGPLGVEFCKNIKDAWWNHFIRGMKYNVGIDASILMNPKTWEASGHVGGFSDPLIDCRNCKSRHRADKLIEEFVKKTKGEEIIVDGWENERLEQFIKDNGVVCPNCGKSDFTGIRQFNLMYKTYQGVTEDSSAEIYLRPETAQGIFVNFKNVQRTSRKKLPFGIGQIGKAFRNEITPGNFIFRTREFEQMEIEFFCKPGTDLEWHQFWKDECRNFLLSLGMKEENIRLRDHQPEELSHYSTATTDIEYKYPFGWGELWGIADRTDFDLRQHQTYSGEDMTYLEPDTGERYIPYCIEPSVGVGRAALAFLIDAYDVETVKDAKGKEDTRVVLRLHPALAPVKAAVLPLSKKLSDQAAPVYEELSKYFNVDYDEAGSIGKRYRREDEAGTPFCICVDFDTQEDGCVTVRDRDTMEQVRIPVQDVRSYIEERLAF